MWTERGLAQVVRYKTDKSGQMYIPSIISEEVILYSTGCPKCKILESKLQSKGIYYTKNTSVEKMENLGFTTVPVLCVGERYLDFGEAVKWVNSQEV